jgi:hypothetical protein
MKDAQSRLSQCDAREVETTKIKVKVDMEATMHEVISEKE